MNCPCLERIEQLARARAGDARRRAEHELPDRLRLFSEAMMQGAIELVARHLVKAAIYRASLDAGGSKEVSDDGIISAFPRVIEDHPALVEFQSRNRRELLGQLDFVDSKTLLRGPTWKRTTVPERLGGLLGGEIREAEVLVGRLGLLRERLPTWSTIARASIAPSVVRIADPHERRGG